jgi:hypothetical protein
MVYEIPSNYDEFTLLVKVQTERPEKIRVIVKDCELRDTVFTDRFKTVNGEATFFVRMPVSGKKIYVLIYNERIGNLDVNEDKTFKVTEIKKVPLEKKMDVVDFSDKGLRSFVKFCTRFCFNAGQLTSGVYKSSDGKYTIEYLPTIVYPNGRESSTPARIGVESGIIQVSQAKFRPMTIPMRMAILLHEYSHFYVNDEMHNESEADLNGLLIYLGLGYPRIEAHQSFLNTFMNVPSQQNKDRYDKINKFIQDFEKNNYIVYE